MRKNQFGEIILSEQDLCDVIMRGKSIDSIQDAVIESDIDIQHLLAIPEIASNVKTWHRPESRDISVDQFDAERQSTWFMPQEYRDTDIAQHILSLCETPEQLQRAGQELLLYQERGLFDLLRYLRYLVDVMRDNDVIWGVGRGSSVASYVLYLLGVHRIDSMFYDLDPREFLR